jgi:dTDP-4-dehydrorhamnose reductase
MLTTHRPDVVINTAAFHKVEACEEDPERAFAVNCLAVRQLAMACQEFDVYLCHISTDYIFDGTASEPYPEGSAPNPLNVYGASKAAGEFLVRNSVRRHLIVRTSSLFGLAGSSGKGGNFVETMLRLASNHQTPSVVVDQIFSPTSTSDVAAMILRLIRAGANGTYHVTNSGSCSWYDFAKAVFDVTQSGVQVIPCRTADRPSIVRRPSYSVLDNRRLRTEGYPAMRPWTEALASYLAGRPTWHEPQALSLVQA